MAADPRFYDRLGPCPAAEIAKAVSGQLVGEPGRLADTLSAGGEAGPGTLFYLTEGAKPASIAGTGGIGLVPTEGLAARLVEAGHTAIISPTPKAAIAKAAPLLVELRIHSGEPLISPDAEISPEAILGPGCIIGPGARLASGVMIGAGAVIGPGVVIGSGTRVGAQAVVSCALVGERCTISAGVVIGETGFGLAYEAGAILNLPHVGRVLIGDQVTIGANCTIDRGMFRDTELRDGCRIDNLCHIAHNVIVGENAVMAAFAGVSGSVVIGKNTTFAGRVGIADHLTIGDGARLSADAAVMNDVPAGETWAGTPAQPIRKFMREVAWIRRESTRGRKPRRDDDSTSG